MAISELPTWKRGEIVALTSLRGIAALGVAAAHLTGFAVLHRQYLWVDFFFVLSGFILVHAYKATFRDGITRHAALTFFRARFFRIYPLHLAMLLVMVALETMKLATQHHGFTGYNSMPLLIQNIFLVQNWALGSGFSWNMPAWSISTEMAAYILFPIILCFGWRMRGAMAGLAAVAATGLGWQWLTDSSLTSPSIVRCLCEFSIGMTIYMTGPVLKDRASLVQLICIPALLVVFITSVPDLLAVPVFALLVSSLGSDKGPLARALQPGSLRYLGLISYSIYLVHFPVIQFFSLLDHRVLHDTFANGGPLVRLSFSAAVLPMILGIASLTYFFLEVPCRQWGVRRFVRNRMVLP